MNIRQLPAFEKLIHEHLPLFESVRVPTPILFKRNIVRKDTPHVVLTLVALDESYDPCFVIKLSEHGTPEAEQIIFKEFQTLVSLSQIETLKGTIPEPVNCFRMHNGLFALYRYSPSHMLFPDVERCQTLFSSEWITVPINWLKKFQKKTSHGYLTRDHLNVLIEKERSRISPHFRDALNPIIDDLLKKMENRLERLLSHEAPIGYTHGDFNIYNIGTQKDSDPIIFDWEDSEPNYPIIFDYFYFILIFYWSLFWIHDKADHLNSQFVNENMDQLIEVTKDLVAQLQKQSPSMTVEDIDTLFLLFLIRNTCLDSEFKRENQGNMERWLLILDQINESSFLLDYLLAQKQLLLSICRS